MINNAQLFGKYVVDFEYALVSVNDLTESKISSSNTLIDNIFLADKAGLDRRHRRADAPDPSNGYK